MTNTARIAPDGADEPLLLRDMNEALLVSSIRQQELAEQAQRAEALIECQKGSLEMALRGEPIEEVLDFLARSIEGLSRGGVVVALHLMEADGCHFGYVAAPSLPASYALATKGMDARRELGPCSSAVVSRTPTVVRDFAAEKRWPAFSAEVVSLGLRACFTTPIVAPDRRVLGTFAIYYREPRDPGPHDRELVDIVTRTVAVVIDRKQADAALRESEERFRALFASAPMAVFVCDTGGVIRYYNARAAELWGREPVCGEEKHCGSTKLWLPDGTRLPHDQSPMVRVLRTGVPAHNVEVFIERPDGSRLPVLVNFAALKTARGEITGAITSFIDITDRVRLTTEREEALGMAKAALADAEAANRAKDVFLATLSHELRTPLNAILGWSVMLRTSGKCEIGEVAEGLAVIERNARVQGKLIEDVLDIARIVSGKFTLDPRPCDLKALAYATLDAVRPSAYAKKITIDIRGGAETLPGSPWILGDPARLQQVLWNLLTNAVKFTPRGGSILIRLEQHETTTRLSVKDSGKGIPAAFLPFVFDRFKQADEGTTRVYGGLGLGLSIVRQIVELHNGTVSAESDGEGLGATFTVELPLQTSSLPAPAPAPAPAHDNPNLDGLRVLIVDDETDSRNFALAALKSVGATVVGAGSAQAGFELASASAPPAAPFDVFVSDIGMPSEDGYSLMRRLRGAGFDAKTLPAVALTAFASPEDKRRALLAGFQVHLAKPVDPLELIAVVASLAGRTGT